jgi:cobalamin biosynthesis Mg chelatase CobN
LRNRDASTDRDLQNRASSRTSSAEQPRPGAGSGRSINQEEKRMADNGSSTASTGIIAILVIFVILVVGALFVFGGRWFGGNKRIDVNIGTPAK